jgi:uncharacterized protein
MKMVLDDAGDLNIIGAYSPGEVRIRGQIHPSRLLVLPREIHEQGLPGSVMQLDEDCLAPLREHGISLLILGTGERQHFPPPERLAPLIRAGIGYEIMDNAAACRTFNILLGEGREAALLLLDDPD